MGDCCFGCPCAARSKDDSDLPARRSPLDVPIQVSLANPRSSSGQSQNPTGSRIQQALSRAYDPAHPTSPHFRGPVELDQLVVEDSDTDDEYVRLSKKQNGALEAIRLRLIRQFSNDSDMRRRSRMDAGSSEEEISRRAELKRLRQKRIQDELQIEDVHDSSSKDSSLSTLFLRRPRDLSQLGGGPRDTIEFTVTDEEPKSKHWPSSPGMEINAPEHSHMLLRRRSSCPQSSMDDKRKWVIRVAHGDRISLPDIGASNTPRPESAQHSSPDSLSSSFSRFPDMAKDGVYDGEHSGLHVSQSWDDQSTLGVWLVAQAIQSRDSSAKRLPEVSENVLISHNESQTISEKLEDARRSLEVPSTHTQHEYTSPFESWTRWTNGCTAEQEQTEDLSDDTPEAITMASPRQSCSGDNCVIGSHLSNRHGASEDEVPTAVTSPVDNTSSNYPSVMPSFQPSPLRSHTNLHNLSFTDLKDLELSPFKWHGNPSMRRSLRLSEGCSSYRTAEDELDSLHEYHPVIHDLQHPLKVSYTSAASSIALDETASFRQREAELLTIDKRFGDASCRRKLPNNTSSRFKEEFNDAVPSRPGKSSLRSIMHLSVPRLSGVGSSRIATGTRSGLGVPDFLSTNTPMIRSEDSSTDGYHQNHSRSRNISSSTDFDRQAERQKRATNLWHRAIKLEAKERERGRHDSTSQGAAQLSVPSSKKSMQFIKSKWKGRSRQSSLSSYDTVPESSRLTPHADEILLSEPQSHLGALIQRWETEMMQNKRGSRPPKSPPPKKLTKPPQSWARYPSHTREKRTAQATFEDGVKLKDLAVRGRSSEGHLQWATDRSAMVEGSDIPESGSRLLAGKFGKVVKSGLSRLFPARDGIVDSSKSGLYERCSTGRAGGALEYPEMEILPTEAGYRELTALEAEIISIKRVTPSATSHNEDKRLWSRSMGSRVSAMLLGNTAEEQDAQDDLDWADSFRSPATPPASRAYSSDRRTASELFVTPLSQLTYPGFAARDSGSMDPKFDADSESIPLRKVRSTVHFGYRRVPNLFSASRSMLQPLYASDLQEVDAKLRGRRESRQEIEP